VAELILLHGYIGAGKTTLARRLAAESGALRLCPDLWLVRLFGPDPDPALWAADGPAARLGGLLGETAEAVLARGVDVIMDHGYWRRASRDAARAMAARAGASARLIHVTAPEPVLRARALARPPGDPPAHFRVTAETFDVLKTRFEPLAPDEPHETVITG